MVVEFIQNNPRISIILIGFLVTLLVTIVNYFMTDKEKMKEIKTRQKELREELKKHKNNPEKVLELNKKAMEDIPEQMKQSFKPLLVTIIPLLLFFGWMKEVFAVTSIASTWIFWYIGASLIFSIILRKLFKLQ